MTRQLAALGVRLAASVCLLSAGATAASAQINCFNMGNSVGPPIVHDPHILCGEINANGRAVGFHSRPGGINPVINPGGGGAVLQIIAGGNITVPAGAPAGIYRLNNFTITRNGVAAVKNFSTMFPDACNAAAVLAAIRNAAIGANPGQQFNGQSGAGCQAGNPPAPFNIQGYTNANGDILTGYPRY